MWVGGPSQQSGHRSILPYQEVAIDWETKGELSSASQLLNRRRKKGDEPS